MGATTVISEHGIPQKPTGSRIGRPNKDSQSIEISTSGFDTETASMQEPSSRNNCRYMIKGATVDIAGLGPFVTRAVSTRLLSPISPVSRLCVTPETQQQEALPFQASLPCYEPELVT